MKMHFTKALGVCCTFFAFFLISSANLNAQSCTVDPGCAVDVNSTEYATVIANDPFCCNSGWDGICQSAYEALDGPINPAPECEPDCPALGGNIGDSCDDGDPLTINDVITEDCLCEGVIPGAGVACGDPLEISSLPFSDADNTANFDDVYSNLDMPEGVTYPDISTGFQSAFYLNGDEVVYSYTASEDQGLEISLSGIDTWVGLYVFSGCPFTETLAYHIETGGDTRNIQGLPVSAGETIYIVISTNPLPQSTAYTLTVEEFFFDCPALEAMIGDPCDDGDPTTFNDVVTEDCLCEGVPAPAGATCGAPISVGSLPFTDADNTENFFNTYASTDVPAGVTYPDISNGTGSTLYLNGDDVVYEYTADFDGLLEISLEGTGTWAGLWIFKGCPFTETLAHDVVSTAGSRNIQGLPITTGETIYVVISTWPAPQTTPYSLTIDEFVFDCPALEANIGDPCDDGDPDTINDVVTEDCVCAGVTLGAGAQCSDPIIVGSLPYNDSNNTANFGNFTTTMPTTTTYPAPVSNGTGSASYISGPEVVYEYTVDFDGGLDISLANVSGWVGLMAFKGCPFDERLAFSTATTGDTRSIAPMPVETGETIYIVVSTWLTQTASTTYDLTIEEFAFDCPALEANIGDPCDDGDIFTVGTTVDAECECTGGTAVPVGGACFNPIFVSSLPFTDTDNTANFLDIYSAADMPAGVTFPENSTGGQSASYLNGDDAVYSYIPPSNGAIDITLSDHGTWAGLWVLKGCPEFDETVAYHTGSDGNGRSIEGLPVEGGQLYYIVVSTFPAPQSIDYTLTIDEAEFDCPNLEANIGNSCDDGDPGTFDEIVTENCECIGTPYDCPAEQAMFGDICDFNGDLGIIDENCDCIEFVFLGCTNGSPFGTRSVECQGTDSGFVEITGSWVQEYSPLNNVLNGQEFTFSATNHTAGNIDVFYITITNETGTEVLAAGVSPLSYTATSSDNLRFYTHGDPTCFGEFTGSASSHTRRVDWDCANAAFDCPGVGNFGDSCDADGEIGEIDENCDCVPVVFEGCTDGFLFGTITTLICDSINGSVTGAWVNEYSNVPVEEGTIYTFYTSENANIDNFFITIADESDNVLAFGVDTVVWTSDIDGTVRFYTHGSPDCAGDVTGSLSSHTKFVDAECAPVGCQADGGTLTALGPVSFCVGTGQTQQVFVQLSGAVGEFGRYGLLDTDNNVIGVRTGNGNFQLDTLPPGQYRIRHLRFEADVDAALLGSLTNASQLANVEGCWASSNTLNIFLSEEPDGGTLTATSPTTVCEASGSVTSITTSLTGASGNSSRFFLVNVSAAGNPVIANNSSGNFNLNPYSTGTYQVRHLSYQQGVDVTNVNSASDLQGCFDISNGVTVQIVSCASAQLESTPNPTAGQSFVTFTNPREEMATLEVYDMSGRLVSTLFRQTTAADQEYRLEFDGQGLPNGVYLYRLTTPTEVIVDKFMIAK